MKKFVLLAGAGILLGIIGIVVFGILNLGTIIKTATEKFGPQMTQSEVKLESADISFLNGSGQLDGLLVGNPAGFTTPEAIKVGTIRVKVQKDTLTKEKIIIDEIVVLGPEITYEKKDNTDNFNALLANVKKAVASEDKAQPKKQEAAKDEGAGKKIQINNFIVKDAKVTVAGGLVKLFGDKGVGISVPDIHLKDIGKDKDTTPAEAVQQMLTAMTKDVTGTVGNMATSLQKNLQEGLKQGQDALKSGADDLKNSVDDATKGLKGLFGGEKQ